jgi:hypothetical protein
MTAFAGRIGALQSAPAPLATAGGMTQEGLAPMHDVPYGYCHCGCGEKTTICPRTINRFGRTAGEPVRYLPGHHLRKKNHFALEDRGYTTPCWIWQLATNPKGYGRVRVPNEDRKMLAHRFYYEKHVGPVPEGLQLDHLCRVRACVNPDHLEPVTAAVNTQRGRNALLTPASAFALRFMAASTSLSVATIADTFGINDATASHVLSGRSWKVPA